MEQIIEVLSRGEIDIPPPDDLKLKAARAIKNLDRWPKLSNFLLMLFGRPEIMMASGKKLKYLNTVLDQIMEQFPHGMEEEKPGDVEIALFMLLLRYNFNHERVYKFYMAEIGHLVSNNKHGVEHTLRSIRIHCEVPPRKDMAYNKIGNTLGEDLVSVIDRHFDVLNIWESYIRPIDVKVPGNVFLPFIGFMVDAGLIEKSRGAEKFYHSLQKIFRGPVRAVFSLKTIKNRIGADQLSNLEGCREILLDMLKLVDDKIKTNARKGGRRELVE